MRLLLSDGIIICYKTKDGIIHKSLDDAITYQRMLERAERLSRLADELKDVLEETSNAERQS